MDQASDPLTVIAATAARDPEFKAALLTDPRAAIEARTGTALPDDWALVAQLDDDGDLRLGFVDDELPADYLADVGGGSVSIVLWNSGYLAK